MDLNSLPRDSKHEICYRLKLEFDGSDYHGWQLQAGDRTVQGEIEAALTGLFPEKPRVIGAGRTDAGVHATGMVAHFRSEQAREPAAIRRALNAKLPPDVRVLDADIAPPGFHARFDAKWRAYTYRILSRPHAIGRQYGWYLPDSLNRAHLAELALEIIGDHCFRAFCHERPDEEHYRSIVYQAAWSSDSSGLLFEITAIRFLHGMVRLLVGTMVDIARGSLQVKGLQEIIAAEDVRKAGTKAPPQGLTLTAVGYNDWPQL